jgi:uncharacterized protein (TIGR02453 family)
MATQNADPKIAEKGFGLLEELSANNTREWYKLHKEQFEQRLLHPFAAILSAISSRLHVNDMAFDGGKETMFRMHRDVRFSKDKSPYKTNVSGLLTHSGKKREKNGFVYLQLDAHGGFGACGRYALDAKALGPIRDRIIEEEERFSDILAGLREKGLDLMREDSLESMPRGYAEHADHPFTDELKLTNMIVKVDLPKTAWKKGDVVERVAKTALASRDFIAFVSV